jgi:hypothetical protein
MDTYIGYVLIESLGYALTYGLLADMQQWQSLQVEQDPTTALLLAPASADVARCMTDPAYFQSLLG